MAEEVRSCCILVVSLAVRTKTLNLEFTPHSLWNECNELVKEYSVQFSTLIFYLRLNHSFWCGKQFSLYPNNLYCFLTKAVTSKNGRFKSFTFSVFVRYIFLYIHILLFNGTLTWCKENEKGFRFPNNPVWKY